MTNCPDKAYREGISIMELADMFPDEASATKWFEGIVWPNGRHCPRCGSADTSVAARTSGLPYYCSGCQKPFSVRIGTALERSKVPLRKWAFAIYLELTNLKGVSSIRLRRDVKVTQKTAWFMLHRIRKAWATDTKAVFTGPVEAARVVQSTDKPTLQGFIRETVEPGPQSYIRMDDYGHEAVNRPVSEYVRDQAHTNGVE